MHLAFKRHGIVIFAISVITWGGLAFGQRQRFPSPVAVNTVADTTAAPPTFSQAPAGAAAPYGTPAYNPTGRPDDPPGDASVPWDAFFESLRSVTDSINGKGEVPNSVSLDDITVAPGDYLAALAKVVIRLGDGGSPPDEVTLSPVECRFEDSVDEAAASDAWKSAMMPPGFAAPKMVELAKLLAWTLKPAVLGNAP